MPGEVLYDEKHLQRLCDADDYNSQYIHSIFCQEYEKNMLDAITQKQIMNGSVPSILDKPKHDQIKKKVADLIDIFYNGDKLTKLELDIERMYISEKLDKHTMY